MRIDTEAGIFWTVILTLLAALPYRYPAVLTIACLLLIAGYWHGYYLKRKREREMVNVFKYVKDIVAEAERRVAEREHTNNN